VTNVLTSATNSAVVLLFLVAITLIVNSFDVERGY